ncbi:alginate O-acetylase AlgJ [Rhodoferax lithotrophicus]|uniref:Alginate O-acetylase AlgJ n=1 Tax=Rhodoferax lithotrophicus TaxID=2798804 RepID=A0ABM7MH89_9BURK|nr:hypothetical protein [Rhodoferax sp. MIZ03]BCO25580.1 alginate O-acetylase AlgJ [Rhodoferax sp. MIZ03]
MKNLIKSAFIASSMFCIVAQAADSPTIIGKNDWLFIHYEFAQPSDSEDTQATIQTLIKANKLFEKKGITLALVLVPSKITINYDQLPDGLGLDSYTSGKYESAVKSLRASGVNVVSLKQAFLNSPNRNSDTPLFLRLDTHWSFTGALLAAETIQSEFTNNPQLKSALAKTPEEKYTLTWATNKVKVRTRDLVKLLPKGAPTYPPEEMLKFNVNRLSESNAGLLGSGDTTAITVIGSSYTNKNTGYPDAIRYTLQRNLLDISIPVDQGPWVGMDAYLRDDAFKSNPPKVIIWEIPERELRSPPNYKYRDTRYIIDNNEWVSKIEASLK